MVQKVVGWLGKSITKQIIVSPLKCRRALALTKIRAAYLTIAKYSEGSEDSVVDHIIRALPEDDVNSVATKLLLSQTPLDVGQSVHRLPNVRNTHVHPAEHSNYSERALSYGA